MELTAVKNPLRFRRRNSRAQPADESSSAAPSSEAHPTQQKGSSLIVGLDIGYSNLKFAIGSADAMRPAVVRVLPSGAGPIDSLPQAIGGDRTIPDGGVVVSVGNGTEWVAGIEPYRIQDTGRELHRNYIKTTAYRALLHAALAHVEGERVSQLVTGLPVAQRADPAFVDAVREVMGGRHVVQDGRIVEVEKVTVMSQPSGAYLDFARDTDEFDLLEKGRIVALDPGFYSTDWVVIEDGDVRQASSGSSTHAMSTMLDHLDRLLKERHGATLGPDRLEYAVRTGDHKVVAGGRAIDISGEINEISAEVAEKAMSELSRAMRHEHRSIDAVLLTGGGAKRFHDAARRTFDSARVIVPEEPVCANARGFFYWAA